MSAFPKAAVQNGRVGVELNVCFWPKADIETESKTVFVNVCFGGKKRTFGSPTGVEPAPVLSLLAHSYSYLPENFKKGCATQA